MDITIAIRSLILSDSGISALVGTRVYADHLPQESQMPAIVLWVNKEKALDSLSGPLGMDQSEFTVACYGVNQHLAADLRLLVRAHIGGFAGVSSGLFIKGIAQVTGQWNRTDRQEKGSDTYRWISSENYRVTYDYEPVA